MRLRIALYGGGLLLAMAFWMTLAYGQVLAAQYKATKLGPYTVGIVCLDGKNPVVTNNGGLVIVNCPVK